MPTRRSRRLRKKLHVGEFQVLGFDLKIRFKKPLTAAEADAFIDLFLSEAIEPKRLAYGGWAESGLVVCEGRGSATVEDRESILIWLRGRKEVESADAGELVDVWYPRVTDRIELM